MNTKITKLLFLASVLMLAVSVGEAQTYGGEAAAVRATVTAGSNPVVTTSVLDTGSLPAAGGNILLTGAAVNVPNILSVGDLTVQTSGGPGAVPPTPLSSQSLASVNTLNVGIDVGPIVSPDLVVTADAISSTTLCACSGATRNCTGETVVTNLSITDPDGNNTVLNGTVSGTVNINIFAGGVIRGFVRVNEQITSPGSITVNGIHINLDVLGVVTDVLVATAHSDITCALAPLDDFYSGRATAIRSRNRVSLLDPDITAIVSDTGYLPTTGGAITSTTANPTVPLLPLTAGTVISRTFGGAAGAPVTDPSSSASDSTVEDLGLVVADVLPLPPLLSITADAVSSNTRCTCSLSLPTCVGDSEFVNLQILVAGLPLLGIDLDFPPNQTVVLPLGLGSITFNEQVMVPPAPSIHPENITVNALHLRLNVLGLAQSDTIVASSHSDIDCATIPSAAPVSVSGRVVDVNGRGISRAIVNISDGSGFTRTAMTGTYGAFTLRDIPSGASYFVSTEARGYRFETQTISLEDNVSGLVFSPIVTSKGFSPSPANTGPVRSTPPVELSSQRATAVRRVY